MEWMGFVFLMFVLKIPLIALIWLVWWAIRQVPEEDGEHQGEGGGNERVAPPQRPFPRHPRRGPHGDPEPTAPPRVRTTVARSRTPER
ncbi:MAG TPA: hypothetical protein VK506_12480 [Conexibacter sp.]|nr:hypothetical protein [Conexibacter sp.]